MTRHFHTTRHSHRYIFLGFYLTSQKTKKKKNYFINFNRPKGYANYSVCVWGRWLRSDGKKNKVKEENWIQDMYWLSVSQYTCWCVSFCCCWNKWIKNINILIKESWIMMDEPGMGDWRLKIDTVEEEKVDERGGPKRKTLMFRGYAHV